MLPNGNTAQFAFSAATSGNKLKGAVAVLERNAAGAMVNVFRGMLVVARDLLDVAQDREARPGKAAVNGVGNYGFVLTGVDIGTASSTPSSPDTLALQLTAPGGSPLVPSLTFPARAVVAGGNINIV